ncbi:hypothetical protein CDAR_14781 [Caerostris darwini]|uniref:Uncharacterized protein n=1 Tax=Caerostris darwini TaxID=1538125 RepID=A0AAV4WAA6_9ARAC|nr:hypothetical protein CDAR_14781 [Caerostris darwini]
MQLHHGIHSAVGCINAGSTKERHQRMTFSHSKPHSCVAPFIRAHWRCQEHRAPRQRAQLKTPHDKTIPKGLAADCMGSDKCAARQA